MKLCSFVLNTAWLLAWHSSPALFAQAPAAPASPAAPAAAAPTPAQAILKARLAGQSQRASLLASEIHNADVRIEGRFDALLTTLRVVSDSKDSHTKVTRMKEQTIASLQQAVTYYQQKRAWLEEQMVRPTFNLTQTQKQMISNDFEERIEKRVKQIVDLYKTFPKHEDFERYKAAGINSFGGVSYEDSEDYRQNLRLSSHTSAMRSKLIKDIQASINQLHQENLTLADMASKAANPELGEVYGDEQRKNEQLRDVLKENLEAIKAGPTVPGRPVSGHEAQALDKVIKHSVDSLQGEFTLLFSRYAEWLTAASSFNTLRASESRP